MSWHRLKRAIARSPHLQAALKYWNTCRQDHPMPAPKDVRPDHIPHLLPRIYLLERNATGVLEFRLAGTGLREIFGAEATHKTVHALFDTSLADRMSASHLDALTHHRVEYMELRLFHDGDDDLPPPPDRPPDAPREPDYVYRQLLLPLASDHQTPDMLFGCVEADLSPALVSQTDVALFLRDSREFSMTVEVVAL